MWQGCEWAAGAACRIPAERSVRGAAGLLAGLARSHICAPSFVLQTANPEVAATAGKRPNNNCPHLCAPSILLHFFLPQNVHPEVAAIAEEAPEDVLEAAEAKDDPVRLPAPVLFLPLCSYTLSDLHAVR